jgi:hypothetical protein
MSPQAIGISTPYKTRAALEKPCKTIMPWVRAAFAERLATWKVCASV